MIINDSYALSCGLQTEEGAFLFLMIILNYLCLISILVIAYNDMLERRLPLWRKTSCPNNHKKINMNENCVPRKPVKPQ